VTKNIVAIAEETAASSREVADATNGLATGMESYTYSNKNLMDIVQELHLKTSKFVLEQQA
jgi:hypothetical protein